MTPADIRRARAENPKPRARDFAEMQGISEAALVASRAGQGVTRIAATPDKLFPLIATLGDVMALTRNASCVHERRGTYEGFHSGAHASMVLGAEIDMRMFPSHWLHGFAVEDMGEHGTSRSLQVFDAHGDAVHKVHLKPESDVAAFASLVDALRVDDQGDAVAVTPRPATEAAKGNPDQAQALRTEWDRMTDTHQFLMMAKRLNLNRLGANRIAGAPYSRALQLDAVTRVLTEAALAKIQVMIFVGNPGCIQIHGGLIEKIVPMGPWINVMDPRFNLHLRADHIAEVWLVNKPTAKGAAISVEAFDADGMLILQIFGKRTEAGLDAWNALTLTLPSLAVAEVVA